MSREVVAIAKLGTSLTGFAGKIGVSYDTIKAWVKVRPDFAIAVAVAKAARCYGLEVECRWPMLARLKVSDRCLSNRALVREGH